MSLVRLEHDGSIHFPDNLPFMKGEVERVEEVVVRSRISVMPEEIDRVLFSLEEVVNDIRTPPAFHEEEVEQNMERCTRGTTLFSLIP